MSTNDHIAPSLINLNISPNLLKELNTMAMIQSNEGNSPQSPEPSIPSLISTPPMYVTTIEGWDTPHATTDDAKFYAEDELGRV